MSVAAPGRPCLRSDPVFFAGPSKAGPLFCFDTFPVVGFVTRNTFPGPTLSKPVRVFPAVPQFVCADFPLNSQSGSVISEERDRRATRPGVSAIGGDIFSHPDLFVVIQGEVDLRWRQFNRSVPVFQIENDIALAVNRCVTECRQDSLVTVWFLRIVHIVQFERESGCGLFTQEVAGFFRFCNRPDQVISRLKQPRHVLLQEKDIREPPDKSER